MNLEEKIKSKLTDNVKKNMEFLLRISKLNRKWFLSDSDPEEGTSYFSHVQLQEGRFYTVYLAHKLLYEEALKAKKRKMLTKKQVLPFKEMYTYLKKSIEDYCKEYNKNWPL